MNRSKMLGVKKKRTLISVAGARRGLRARHALPRAGQLRDGAVPAALPEGLVEPLLPRRIPGRQLLLLCLLLALPARAGAGLITVTISNPSVYTAVFEVDTTADTVTWVSGLDAPGGMSWWTPAVPRLLTLTSNPVVVDLFPDDPSAVRQLFINPDFTAGSDMFLLAYPTTFFGMMWNEGSALVASNHANLEDSFSALRMPTSATTAFQLTYSSHPSVLNPGWSIGVTGTAIPEPTSVLLFFTGVLVVGARVRRTRTAARGD